MNSKCCCNTQEVNGIQHPNAGICDICHPSELSAADAAAICPPIGEPKTLTMMAPVVFDEAGINLCRVVSTEQLVNLCEVDTPRTTDVLFDGIKADEMTDAEHLQLQVVDIDFNFVCPKSCRYSEIKAAKNRPNRSRIILRDIDVTFAVKILDSNCKVYNQGMMTLRYLPSEDCPGYDDETNPSNVVLDLYTPYGISYAPENPAGCNKLVPTINYIGFVEGQHCHNCHCEEECCKVYKHYEPSNALRQGISAQALAKVIAADDDCLAIGLTLYIKSIYFVQYKFKHEGLCVPPKYGTTAGTEANSCLEFVNGDLMEQSIKPLSVCVEPKSFEREPEGSCCKRC